MKRRILSMLLAIMMVVGMLPGTALTASAAETAPLDVTGRTNVLKGITTFSNHCNGGSNKNINLMFDGIITRGTNNYADLGANGIGWNALMDGTKRYNNDGKLVDDGKYLTYFDFEIKNVYVVDTLRVFLDSASEAKDLLIDGFDILVSENKAGPWTTVYSVSELYCGEKYKVYTDADTGLQTCYVEAEFTPAKAKYIRFAFTQPRCSIHSKYKYPNTGSNFFRITELELYQAKSYTVSFNANGGAVTPASATAVGGKLAELPTPTKAGYTFAGWFDAATGGNAITTDTVFKSDATIHAQWTENLGFVGRNNVLENKTVYYSHHIPTVSDYGTKTGHEVAKMFDGTITRGVSPNENYCDCKIQGTPFTNMMDQRYRYGNDGEVDPNGAYLTYIDYKMDKVYTVDALRIFLDEATAGQASEYLVDGFDILVREKETDEWTTVYSVTKLRTNKQYKVYTEEGTRLQTCYVEAEFVPIKAQYIRFALTEPRPAYDVTSSLATYFRITELQLFEAVSYNVTVTTPANGTVTADKATAAAGETVTLDVTPAEGYEIDTVKYNNTAITAVQGGYSFTMPASDVTVTATFKAKAPTTYTVTFVDHDGTPLKTETVNHGESATAPANPVRTGWKFTSWDKEFSNITADLTVTAQYSINQYTITFNTDGGAVIAPITQDYGTVITAPAAPTKTGYTFVGWDKAVPTTMPAENVTIKAKWTVNQYTITFDTDGGTVIAPITQDYGTAITAPAAPTKTGHTFTGWDKAIPTTMPAENVTLKAMWTANLGFIGRRNVLLGITTHYSYHIPTVSSFGKDGYGTVQLFDGIVTRGPSSGAKQNYCDYKIIGSAFNNMVNNGIRYNNNGEVDPNGKYFTYFDYKIDNIYTVDALRVFLDEATGGVASNLLIDGFDILVREKETDEWTTVYSVTELYSDKKYKVYTEEETGLQTCYIDATFAPVKAQYIRFALTQPRPAFPTAASYFRVTEIELFEVVNPVYTISFNANGGSVTPVSAETVYRRLAELPTPTYEGYTFAGWFDAATGGNAITTDTVFTENTTVYAQWTANWYTITFNTDGGSEIAPIYQAANTAVTAPAAPTKTGYTFAGWDKAIPETMPAENVTIKAKWTVNQYTITFNTDGGTEIAPITQDYGTAIIAPAVPTKSGYTFAGWDKALPETMPAENVTLKAMWTANLGFTDRRNVLAGITTYDDYCTGAASIKNVDKMFDGIVTRGTENYGDFSVEKNTWADLMGNNKRYNGNGEIAPDGKYLTYIDYNIGGVYTVDALRVFLDEATGGKASELLIDGFDILVREKETDAWTTVYSVTELYCGEKYKVYTEEGTGLQTCYVETTFAPVKAQYIRFAFTQPRCETTAYGYPNTASRFFRVTEMELFEVVNPVYTISFNANGGSVTPESAETVDRKLSELPTPTYEGYTFAGWFDAATGGNAITTDTIFTANTTVYARWTINRYTITFNTNGGTAVAPITQDYGTAVTAPAAPTKSGFDFGGWYANAELTEAYVFGTMPAANITVYAKWNASAGTAYTVKHYHQDTSGSGYTLYESETLRGMTGTATAAQAKNYLGFTAQTFAQTTVLPDGSTVVEIKYDRNIYTVSFVTNYGVIRYGNITQYTYGVGAKLPVDVTKGGSLFAGWYDNAACVGIPVTEITTTDIGNKIFYAKWNYIFIPIITPTYPPVVNGGDHGNVTVTPTKPEKGDVVTVAPTPENGYEVDTFIVTDKNGTPVTVVDNGNGTYSFKQPSGSVKIEVTFKEIIKVCPGDQTCPMYGYTDLNMAAWYHDGVHFCIENGLMSGVDTKVFAPDMTTSRAMIVTILWRLAGEPVVNYAMSFEDVAAGAWYTEAIRWAASEGIVNGYSDTAFGPNDNITREQLATVLYRYEQKNGGGFKGMWMFHMDYVDLAEVSDWAHEAMCWMNMNSIVNGKPGKVLDPKGNATRAEAATMLYRYCDVISKD